MVFLLYASTQDFTTSGGVAGFYMILKLVRAYGERCRPCQVLRVARKQVLREQSLALAKLVKEYRRSPGIIVPLK